jgi:hypothetical protein
MITRLCECGCGTVIDMFDKRNRPRRFEYGHNLKQLGKKHPNWRGGRIIEPKGYGLIYKPDHPYAHVDGYVRENRLIMEEHIGRYLRPDEDVHHINKNKLDNRPENLELIGHAEHTSYHRNHKP